MTPVSWPRNPSFSKWWRPSSTLTTWTRKKVSPWISLGSHSFEHRMITRKHSLGTSDSWSFSGFTTPCSLFLPHLPARTLFLLFVSYLLLPALQSTLHFPLFRPCSWHFPLTLSIGLYHNPLYPYTSSFSVYICVHFPFIMHFNPEDGGGTMVLWNISIHHHTLWCNKPENHKSIFTTVKTSNFALGTSVGNQHFTTYISFKPCVPREPSYCVPSLSYWQAETRRSSPESYSCNTSSRARLPGGSSGIWASPYSTKIYNTLCANAR